MVSLSDLYEPSPDECYDQTAQFTDWFTDHYTDPDDVFVYRDKVFMGRRGSSCHIFGRVDSYDWDHLGEYHFESEGDAVNWFRAANTGSRDPLELIN